MTAVDSHDETVLGIQDRLQILLGEIASDPARILAELPMTSPRERRDSSCSIGTPRRQPFRRNVSVAGLFEAQTERTPENTALVFGDRQWTYTELNVRANRLAHRLRAMGVGFETPGGDLRRAVARDGCRHPGDAEGRRGVRAARSQLWPVERLRFILRDTQASVLLGTNGLSLPTCRWKGRRS